MPRAEVNPKPYQAGTVRSYVNWLMARGHSREEILTRTKAKFIHQSLDVIRRIYGEIETTRQAGGRVNRYQNTANIQTRAIPGATQETENIRVRIRVDFDRINPPAGTPRGRVRENRTYVFDMP